jgi:phosphorylase kinase alpha/beta subunit
MDDLRGRESELRGSCVKTMRGILTCWMRQSDRLERFKTSHNPQDALHTRFDWFNGNVCVDTNECQHHQLDVIALYLLTLVQITTGGVQVCPHTPHSVSHSSLVQIIYSQDELTFVQNLVFYIERAYRIPDFGVWERGSRYNTGSPELHASTLGMTKVGHMCVRVTPSMCVQAALEAMNGFNVYGTRGTSKSVIYVDIDAHNRNRVTFETLLPRESDSKVWHLCDWGEAQQFQNTDAALLMVTGWPAYGTHDTVLAAKTNEKIARRLDARYGLKR